MIHVKAWCYASVVLLLAVVLTGCDLFISPDERTARAAEHIEKHDYRSAMIELKNALEAQPSHVQARVLLAEVSLHLGDAATAEKELRRAIESGASASSIADLAARIRLALGQNRELLAQIAAGEMPLSEPMRSVYRGRALLALRDIAESRAAFSTALEHDPSLVSARIGEAQAQALAGESELAVRTLKELLEEEPSNAEARLALGSIYVSQGRFADASEILEGARSTAIDLPVRQQARLLATLTESHLSSGDIEAARAALTALMQVAQGTPLTMLLSARIAMADQNYMAASSQLQKIVVAMPDFASARFLLGAALLAQGNLHQAEAQLTRVVQQAPDNLEARKLLAQTRLRLEQPDAAMQALVPAQELADSDASIAGLLGLAQLQLGNLQAAVEFVEKSAASRPSDRKAQLELARTYIQANAAAKAVQLLRDLEHDEDDARREALLVSAVAAKGGVAAAKAEVDKLLEMYPRSKGLLNLAAAFYAQRGEFQHARALAGQALSVAPQDTATVLNAARVELAAGNLAAATARLEGLASSQPENIVARLALAELAVHANNLPLAAKWLEELRARHAEAIEPRLGLVRVYLMSKQPQRADEIVRELQRITAKRPDVENAIGLLYLDAGRYDEAGSRFRAAVSADSSNASYWLNLAKVQLATDRRELARQSLERARAADASSVAVVGAQMLLDLRDGKRETAIDRVSQLRKQRPDDAAVNVLEGDLFMMLEEYERAARAYDGAIERRPDASTTLRAYRARRLGRLPEAAAPLQEWVARHPDDFMIQAVLAEAYQRGGQRERAIAHYELIVANRPTNAAVLNNLAWLYYETKDPRAESMAEKAYRLAPTNPSIADTYGWILVELGRPRQGAAILKKIVESGVQDRDIRYHYAAALIANGNRLEGQSILEKLIEEGEQFASRGDARRLLDELAVE